MPGERCSRSEEHTSELQSPQNLVCRLLLEKKTSTALPTIVVEESEAVALSTRLRLVLVRPAARRPRHRDRRRGPLDGQVDFFFLNEPAPPELSPLPHPGALQI